ncbi:insulin-like growth factor binding proteinn-terminal [Anaeramoeba flamelloides]|uniref:Insulin-like growth factor binding proteinn-terminal n=1 Tax=Anaeramoeba flamelloides TaxID=1746091 RepID=A0AAV7YRI6_9EUKA|nr:insulin-like growth factor binding proteinn-terminal [Anaeramoeba flamelloides]
MKFWVFFGFLIFLKISTSFQIQEWVGATCNTYVDPNGNDGASCGTTSSPCKTIQYGINIAPNKGVVCVNPGTYYLTSQIEIERIKVLQSTNGRDTTIIDGQDKTRCLHLSYDHSTQVIGFTFQNCYTSGKGAGIFYDCSKTYDQETRLENCIIKDSYAEKGGGVFIYNCEVTFVDTIIKSNYATNSGGGIYCLASNWGKTIDTRFTNTIIVDNDGEGQRNIENKNIDSWSGKSCEASWDGGGMDPMEDCQYCWNGGNCKSNGVCVCLAGSKAPSPDCNFCSAGTYSETINAADCTSCSLGTFNPNTGSSSSSACQSCGEGTYNDLTGQSKCTECPTGTYNPETGKTSISDCILCKVGEYQDGEGTNSCLKCPMGTYNPVEGATSKSDCISCPAGTYSDITGASSEDQCLSCEEGYYNDIAKGTTCHQCEKGSFANETRTVNCHLCAKGTYQNQKGQVGCKPCATGTFGSQEGLIICSDCTEGTHNNLTQQTVCQDCGLGEYTNEPKMADCISCTKGTYQDQKGQVGCKSCPAGTFGNTTHQTTPDECHWCPMGTISNQTQSTACLDCGKGTYNDETRQTVCKLCARGTYNIYRGADSEDFCWECLAGQSNPYRGHSKCYDCDYGTYQGSTGQSFCSFCDQGTYNNLTRQTSEAACLPCAKGTANGRNAQRLCEVCKLGSFANTTGQTECYKCERGTFSNTSSINDQCKKCEKGSFSNALGSSFCTKCDVGEYQPNEGSQGCLVCANGTYAESRGNSECKACMPGEYSNSEVGVGACSQCNVGEYNPISRQGQCLECQPGSYSNEIGQISCETCGEGYYQNYAGQIRCKKCEYNSYQPDVGLTACITCPPNSITLIDAAIDQQQCVCAVTYIGKSGGPCVECPTGAVCEKTDLEFPDALPGYWHTADDPNDFIPCTPEEACPGGTYDKCNEEKGYTGEVCALCNDHYYRFENECNACPTGINWKLCLAVCVMFILLLSLFTLARRLNEYFGSIAITFSFLQILSIMYNLQVGWPESLKTTFRIALAFNFSFDWLGVECSFSLSYISKLVLFMMTPIICLVMLLIIYGGVILHCRYIEKYGKQLIDRYPKLLSEPSRQLDNRFAYPFKFLLYQFVKPLTNGFSKKEQKNLIRNFINSYTLLLSFLYLILSLKSLDFFRCEKIFDGTWRLKSSPNVICYGSWWLKHLIWVLFFGILYIIGIPVLLITLLIRYSKKLDEKKFDELFGLISYRYSKTWFFWEIIVMMRKLFMVVFRVFLDDKPTVQVILCIIVLVVALLLQARFRPYLVNNHNHLEFSLLLISEAVLFTGLVFKSKDFPEKSSKRETLSYAVIIMILLGAITTLFNIYSEINHRLKVKKGIDKDEVKYENEILNGSAVNTFLKKKKYSLFFYALWIKNLRNDKLKKAENFFHLLQDFYNNNYTNLKFQKIHYLEENWKNSVSGLIAKWYHSKSSIIQKLYLTKILENYYYTTHYAPREKRNTFKSFLKKKKKTVKLL